MGKESTTCRDVPGPAFPTTRWTGLLRIGRQGVSRSREQLQSLFTLYWPAVNTAIRRDWVRDPEESRDLTQEFFLSLLERDFASGLSPDKGRFRHFVKAALKNFLLNQKRDRTRLKRGGGAVQVPLQDVAAPSADFDVEWRRCLLDGAMARLRAECARKEKRFDAFRLHVTDGMTYPDVAAMLGIGVFDVGNAVKWARGELHRIVLSMIGEYAGDDSETHRELEDLFR